MEVKTFEAINMKDAIKAVKREFGPEAIILSTKNKPVGETNDSPIVEVTAAVPDSQRMNSAGATTADTINQIGLDGKMTNLEMKVTSLQEAAATKQQLQRVENGLHEVKLLLLETLRSKDGSPLKNLPEHLVNIDRQMRIMGIDDTHIAELMKHLRTLDSADKDSKVREEPAEDYFKAQAMRWMLKRIKIAPRWNVTSGTTSIHALVGPTGVGKTSSISKLAAHYHKREKLKVLVVSFDNFRLAASEQLRVFTKVVGIPFRAINSANDLPALLEEHSDTELILIDTAGMSPKGDSKLEILESLRGTNFPIDVHLCLSVSSKQSQMDRAVRLFSPLGLQSLMFTKLDESLSFGEIFNLSKKWSIPLSYFSTGQNIPEDIERASRERVIERIFGI